MLVAAFAVLSAVVLLGLALAAPRLGATGKLPALVGRLGLLHGISGAAGFALLLGAISRHHAADRSMRTFGWDAAVLVAAALLAGIAFYVRSRAGRPANAVLVLHGSFAIFGYVILGAYVSSG